MRRSLSHWRFRPHCSGPRGSTCMSELESTIAWLRKQRENAAKAIADLQAGQIIEFQGTDVTDQWVSRYERLIDRYTRLIECYEQRAREAKLSATLKFKD